MSRTFKTVDYTQALDLTVRLGDCLPPDHLTLDTVLVDEARALAGIIFLFFTMEPFLAFLCS